MEMRKFIIEIHPDGSLTWCEYEDAITASRAEKDNAWLSIVMNKSDRLKVLKITVSRLV